MDAVSSKCDDDDADDARCDDHAVVSEVGLLKLFAVVVAVAVRALKWSRDGYGMLVLLCLGGLDGSLAS